MKTLTISGQVFGFLLIISSPMANACAPAAGSGCENMILRPYGVVQRRGPGALYKYWAQERGPHFGRDQIVTFSYSASEIGLWPAGYNPCFCRQLDAPCAHMSFTNLILRYTDPSFGLHPLLSDTSPSSQNERVNAVREEPESQPEPYG